MFKDSRCQTPLITEKFTGTFTIGKDPVDKHTNLDRIRGTVELIIHDKDTLTRANNSKLTDFGFGIKNWELNKPKDLSTNQNAIKYYFLNQDGPDIFRIDLGDTSHDDQLYTHDTSKCKVSKANCAKI